MPRALASAGLALALFACQGRGPGAGPTPAPPQAVVHGPRVAYVDLERVARANPRWSELEALDRRIASLQAELALPPSVQVQVPSIDLSKQIRVEMDREVAQIQPEYRRQFSQEATALQEASRQELFAYAKKLHADDEAELQTRQAALQADVNKAIADKQQEITKDNEQFEQQTLEQYRVPLLNLRLKIEAVQATDKAESERLNDQLTALIKERDGKTAAHDAANQKALEEFQKQQIQRYNTGAADLQTEIGDREKRLIDQKTAELNARLQEQVRALETKLNAQLNTRLKSDFQTRAQALETGARQQVARAQAQATTTARERIQSLQDQLQAAQGQRARLLASMVAEARVEAAALAQEKGWDVILTDVSAAVDVPDVTDDLIARIKR